MDTQEFLQMIKPEELIMNNKVILLRTIHGLFALFFIYCIFYVYYSALTGQFNAFLWIAVSALLLEGLLVFILNRGDCPLIHIQRRIGDDKPFFNLILPPKIAKFAVPFFTVVTFLGFLLLVLRFILN